MTLDEVVSPSETARVFRDHFKPLLEERRQWRSSAGGRQRHKMGPASEFAPSGVEKFSTPVRERLAQPGKDRDVTDDVFRIKWDTLNKLAKLLDWAESDDEPAPVREAAAQALAEADEDDRAGRTSLRVNGRYRRVVALRAELLAAESGAPDGYVAAVSQLGSIVGAASVAIQRITAVTVGEYRALLAADEFGLDELAATRADLARCVAHLDDVLGKVA